MALVLPRVALSGPSWEPIRNLLVRDYAINHVVVSYDPEHQWAWSENTDLSETLLVCTRRKNSEESVKVSYVYRRPRSALEAKVLASRILESNPKAGIEESIILGRDPIASVYELPQERLRKSRNWNTCTALASSKLSNITYKIHSENNIYGIPLIPLADSVETLKTQGSLKDELNIGYDVATYQRCKDAHGNLILDVLEGANVSTLNMLNVSPNATARFKEECSDLQKRKSNFLIAGVARFWLYTVGLSSVFCSRPVISNTMWTIGLKGKQPDENAKVQVLWLNSTLGLLNILGLRQDSKGAFVQFKKEYLPLLKLVDFTKIKKKQRDDLLVLFKKLANDTVPSLPEQLRQGLNTRGFRWRLDSEFLRIVAPSFNITLVADLYERLLRETIINKNARPIQS